MAAKGRASGNRKGKEEVDPRRRQAIPVVVVDDPRLTRVLEIIEHAYDQLNTEPCGSPATFDTIVEQVLGLLHAGVASLEGATKTIRSLVVESEDADPGALDECVSIAEQLHRKICVCCRARAA